MDYFQVKINDALVEVGLSQTAADGSFTCKIKDKILQGRLDRIRGTVVIKKGDKPNDSSEFQSQFLLRNIAIQPGDGESKNIGLELSRHHGKPALCIQGSADRFYPGLKLKRNDSAQKTATLRSPMTGKILKMLVKEGDSVQKGDLLAVIEAMKMENKILAPSTGRILKCSGTAGQTVTVGEEILKIGQ